MKLPRLFRRNPKNETSDLKNPEQWLFDALVGGLTASSGVKVTPIKAMGLATVFSCVNVIAETVATLPLKLMRLNGKNREPARDHLLYDVLACEPNAEMTSTDFRLAMQGNLSLRKNAFAQIRRDNAGRVRELIPLHPTEVEVRRETSGDSRRVVYDYRPNGGPVTARLAMEDVLHLRGISQLGLLGMDPVSTVSDVIGLAIALETNAAKFFANDSKPGLVLEHPGALSDKAFNRIKEWMEDQRGVNHAYKTRILEEGMKFAPVRQENRESQFDETRARQDEAIARVFRVPPHKVGILNRATFSNIEQQNIEWVTDTILPICVIWEQQLERMLLSKEERKAGYYFKFNLGGLLRGDLASRYAAYSQGRNWGWLSVNDIRSAEDMNPIENGDEYLNPLNMVPQGYVPNGAVKTNGTPPAQNRLNLFPDLT